MAYRRYVVRLLSLVHTGVEAEVDKKSKSFTPLSPVLATKSRRRLFVYFDASVDEPLGFASDVYKHDV